MTRLVVLDTNIIISSLLKKEGTAAELRNAWLKDAFIIAISPTLLEELQDVLSRPWFAKASRFNPEEIVEFLSRLAQESVIKEPDHVEAILRDPDDDHVLAAALACEAHCIVSGDQDILTLQPAFKNIEILTLRQFLDSIVE